MLISTTSLEKAVTSYNQLFDRFKDDFPFADECLLSALYRQASEGDFNKSASQNTDVSDRLKNDVWKKLKGMPKKDAEQLFIRELDRVKTELLNV